MNRIIKNVLQKKWKYFTEDIISFEKDISETKDNDVKIEKINEFSQKYAVADNSLSNLTFFSKDYYYKFSGDLSENKIRMLDNDSKLTNIYGTEAKRTKFGIITKKIKGTPISSLDINILKKIFDVLNMYSTEIIEPTEKYSSKLERIVDSLKKIHDEELKSIDEELKSIDFYTLFKHVISYLKKDKMVVSHGDLNLQNIFYLNKKVKIIDFENANFDSAILDFISLYVQNEVDVDIFNLIVEKSRIDDVDSFLKISYIFLLDLIRWNNIMYKNTSNVKYDDRRKFYKEKINYIHSLNVL